MRKRTSTPTTPHPPARAADASVSSGTSRRDFLKSSAAGLAAAALGPATLAGSTDASDHRMIVMQAQGSFAAGGSVLQAPGVFDPTSPAPVGEALHGDHAYVQYQIPPNPRQYPLVMWHGGGQMGKTWEQTVDGREGYQTIFLRRGFAVHIIDQPRRGRAGQSTAPINLVPTPADQELAERLA